MFPHPLGHELPDEEFAKRRADLPLALELLELLHMRHGVEPSDAALEVAGIMGMNAYELLETYNRLVQEWVRKAARSDVLRMRMGLVSNDPP